MTAAAADRRLEDRLLKDRLFPAPASTIARAIQPDPTRGSSLPGGAIERRQRFLPVP